MSSRATSRSGTGQERAAAAWNQYQSELSVVLNRDAARRMNVDIPASVLEKAVHIIGD
ncbi:MAG: hypothetical protein LOD91_05585 [Limnochordales bacterium]